MKINYSKEDKLLTIELTEEIDQHTADKIRRQIDDKIEGYIPRKVIFDFNNITFMDSSGIGMVLGRYKLAKMLGASFELVNVHKSTKKIFDMSGVSRIVAIKEYDERIQDRINEKIIKKISEEDQNEGVI